MTDRDYVTRRDPARYRDTAEQWEAVKDRAVVDRETLRNRMRPKHKMRERRTKAAA